MLYREHSCNATIQLVVFFPLDNVDMQPNQVEVVAGAVLFNLIALCL